MFSLLASGLRGRTRERWGTTLNLRFEGQGHNFLGEDTKGSLDLILKNINSIFYFEGFLNTDRVWERFVSF